MAILKWDDLQLRFELDLDEVEGDAAERAISYEEARQISAAARRALDDRIPGLKPGANTEMPGWWGEYELLIEQGWPWRVACYMAWAASPKESRWPRTVKELAQEVLGLGGPRVISTWRQKYPAIDTTIAMLQAAPLWEHRRDVLETLAKMAKTEDYKAFNDRRLFLEMIGDYTPKSQIDVNRSAKGEGLEERTDEELRRLAGDLTPSLPSPKIQSADFGGGNTGQADSLSYMEEDEEEG